MFQAAENGDIATIKKYLDEGGDINAFQEGTDLTMLMLAALYSGGSGSDETVQFLIDRGADLDASDEDGRTALIIVAGFDSDGGHSENVIKILIDGGANIEAKEKFGRTALMLSAMYGHIDELKVLIEKGADIKATDNGGRTALILAAKEFGEFSDLETLKLLINNGADLNTKDDRNESAFMHLVPSEGRGKEMVGAVKLFLDNGASITETDNDNDPPLLSYCSHSYDQISLDVVKLLVEAGSDVNQVGGNLFSLRQVALSLIAKGGEAESVMEYLIDQGADVNQQDDENLTALMLLARSFYGNPEGISSVMKYLVEKGADLKLKNMDGETAFDMCRSEECKSILRPKISEEERRRRNKEYKSKDFVLNPDQWRKFMKAAKLIAAEFENLQEKTTLYPSFQSLIVKSEYGYEVGQEVKALPFYCKKLVIIGAAVRDWLTTLGPSESFRRKESKRLSPNRRKFELLTRASHSVYPDVASNAQKLLQDFKLETPKTFKVKRVVPRDLMIRANSGKRELSIDETLENWYALASEIGECYEDKILKAYQESLKSLPFGVTKEDDYDGKAELQRIEEEELRRIAEDMELAERLDREWNN